jgi:hypothetical protein
MGNQVLYGLPFNHFREIRDERDHVQMLLTREGKGLRCGPLHILAERALSASNRHLPHPIDRAKLIVLFEKNKPGLIKMHFRKGATVRWKVFQRWAQKNATKICMTTRECIARENEEEAAREIYRNDLEKDLEELLESPISEPAGSSAVVGNAFTIGQKIIWGEPDDGYLRNYYRFSIGEYVVTDASGAAWIRVARLGADGLPRGWSEKAKRWCVRKPSVDPDPLFRDRPPALGQWFHHIYFSPAA